MIEQSGIKNREKVKLFTWERFAGELIDSCEGMV